MKRLAIVMTGLVLCAACGGTNDPAPDKLPSRPRGEVRAPDSIHVLEATFADDGKQVLLAGTVEWDAHRPHFAHERRDLGFFITLADVVGGKEIWKVVQREACRTPAFVPGQPWVIVRTERGYEIWDRKTGDPVKRSQPLFSSWPAKGSFIPSADGSRLIGWGYDATAPTTAPWVLDLRIWDLPGLRQRRRFGPSLVRGHNLEQVIPAPRGTLALLAADPNVVSMQADQHTFRIWDTKTGKVLHEFAPTNEGWNGGAAAWSPDGTRLLLDRSSGKAGGPDRTSLVLWDALAGKTIRTFAGRPSSATHLAFSADGRQAVSADSDHFFRHWEVATGKERKTVPTAATPILALSRNGGMAVSGRRELWDTATGQLLRTLAETAWERPPLKPDKK